MELKGLHKLLLLAALVVWSLVIGGFLAWDLRLAREHMEALAIKEARSNFNKDLAFRLWATRHGGVYVPTDERTPPNPGLSHLPERDITTPSGRPLTLMNPAYMLRQMMEESSDFYGVRGRITSLKPINPDNAPDEWEREALLRFEQGAEEFLEFYDQGGEPVLRLMRPTYTLEGCLKCHAFQGYKVDDVRGGVGVVVPMRPYINALEATRRNRTLFFGTVWLLGMVIIIGLDSQILRRLRAQEEHQRALIEGGQALARANADLTRLAEVSAHHLMEPTRRLVSYSRRLREKLGTQRDEEVGKSLQYVEQSSLYLRNLVRDIQLYLDAAEPRGTVAEQDPAAVLAVVRRRLDPLIAETAAEIVVAADLPPVWLDLPRLQDIFAALLENSLRHRRLDLPPRITISGKQRGEFSCFEISDNGPGIPVPYRERVFEIFERLGSEGQGTGIGLAVVRRIVESRGGEVRLGSSAEGGLAVRFRLKNSA